MKEPGRVPREERETRRRGVDCRANRNLQVLVLYMEFRRTGADWAPKVPHALHRLVLLEFRRYLGNRDHTNARNERRWGDWSRSCKGGSATVRNDYLVGNEDDQGDERDNHSDHNNLRRYQERSWNRRGRANGVKQSSCGHGRVGGTGGGAAFEEALRRQQRVNRVDVHSLGGFGCRLDGQ